MRKVERIGKNIRFLTLNWGIGLVISFMLFPFIVSHVGKELYGAYLLGMTITGYFSFLDLGIRSGVVKFVAEFRGRKDTKSTREIINVSFSFHAVIGLIVAAILFFLSFYIHLFFKIDPANRLIMSQLFRIFSITAPFTWTMKTFRGAIQGLQYYDWLAGVGICIRISIAIATYFLLSRGFGIVFLVMAHQLLTILGGFIFYGLSRYYIKGMRIVFPYFNKELLKKIFNFSVFVFLGGLIVIIIYEVDNIVIGAFVSVAAITVYHIGSILQNVLRNLTAIVGSPSWVACAEMEGKEEYEAQKQLLLRGTKYMSLLFPSLAVIAIMFARPFIICWMGEQFFEGILPAQILLSCWLFNGVIEIGWGILMAKGFVRQLFRIRALNGIFNLILSLILVRFMGIVGVALGTALPMVLVNFPMVLSLISKKLNTDFKEFFSFSLKWGLVSSFLAFVVSQIALRFKYPTNVFLCLLEIGIIYSGITAFIFFLVLSSKERKDFKRLVGVTA